MRLLINFFFFILCSSCCLLFLSSSSFRWQFFSSSFLLVIIALFLLPLTLTFPFPLCHFSFFVTQTRNECDGSTESGESRLRRKGTLAATVAGICEARRGTSGKKKKKIVVVVVVVVVVVIDDDDDEEEEEEEEVIEAKISLLLPLVFSCPFVLVVVFLWLESEEGEAQRTSRTNPSVSSPAKESLCRRRVKCLYGVDEGAEREGCDAQRASCANPSVRDSQEELLTRQYLFPSHLSCSADGRAAEPRRRRQRGG